MGCLFRKDAEAIVSPVDRLPPPLQTPQDSWRRRTHETHVQWVKVMSAVVRDWVFGSPEGEQPPSADVAAEVLAKCKLLELDSGGGRAMEDTTSSLSPGGGARAMEPEPYFCPIEYLYLSEPIVQRLHRAAPLSRREHGHFTVGDLGEVEMPLVSDNHHQPSLPSTASLPPAPGAPSTASHRPPPLPSASAAASAPAAARPRLQLPPGVGARGGGAAGSLLGALGAPQQSMMAEKPRLKVIKLDDVKVRACVRVGWLGPPLPPTA